VTAALSVWLDLCRVLAASVVVFGHARALEITPASVGLHWHRTADDAVIAFFVISGFVIAWSTARARDGLRGYVEARASRVYSVAIPAVLLVLVLDHIGMRLNVNEYAPEWQYPKPWLFVPFHWTFLGGTWFGPMDPFSMASYWSLPYEVWYYALFGCATLLQGRARWIGVALVFAFMGPRMWLLLPCWWIGVLLHQHIDRLRMGQAVAWLLMGLAVLTYVVFVTSGGRAVLDQESRDLYAWFNTWLPSPFKPGGTVHALSDYAVALMFVVFVVGAANCGHAFGPRVAALIRALAGYTFSLYLIHFSLLVLMKAAGVHHPGIAGFLGVLGLIGAVTWLMAQVGEARRPVYRRAIAAVLDAGLALRRRLAGAR